MEAVLLICHGTRLKQGRDEALFFAERCLRKIDVPIKEICFLELASPSIEDGFEMCIRKGAKKVTVIPVLLLAAVHAKVDIPEKLSFISEKYPHIQISYGRPFGVHPAISTLLWERMKQSTSIMGDAVVLLVGRGSRDPDVKRDLHSIAIQLCGDFPVSNVQTCFLTAAEPSFEESLMLAGWGRKQIIIIPYLLFSGLLLNGMKKSIQHQRKMTGQDIILCEPLGYHFILEMVLHSRIMEAMKDPSFCFCKGGAYYVSNHT
ncbi:sirohydrochlorin chelatase [Falsibacillus albus]|uniref:Sirohydrochlorin chelatase n=1 Tax=Falsibacillus albus TaxID=2478915 RepID=A0A3L7JYR0_9BACI|nr:sirohydrochlorin chelatase [Falsibacillus albus]RLQ95883.1 sirohydrochlorin chelatase [Falsibacillus albus]